MPIETRPDPGASPVRDKPDWPTCRGYLGIVLGTMLAFFITARAAGAAQLIFVVIWAAAIAATIQFTKYDRRRRIRKETNDH